MNKITASGMPPHELILKPGVPVICLRNICQQLGLVNGTRIVDKIHPKVVTGIILNGPRRGEEIDIPQTRTTPPPATPALFILSEDNFLSVLLLE